ncbi:MAG TPA: type 2 isopentenyl-diphosphate Delta-isomerase [Anaerolineales bacterium]|nr:type 2 isopentenyl-diphosphate Delta-isomerase [Anaerolineales bacterium]
MSKVTPIGARKTDHIRINLDEDVRSGLTTGLERFQFIHQALPEIDLEGVDLGSEIFGRHLQAPLLISSMTGGTEQAGTINRTLAEAAQVCGIAMGVGSQRAALEQPDLAASFQVRSLAPDILLLANLGAIQLNYGYGIDHCRKAVEMIEADALILHFNALQEAVQPEGETRFAGLLDKIAQVCHVLPVPVIAKEVGWGFSKADACRLAEAGVAAIDVAGAGGTSWSQVEMHRASDDSQRRLAAAFIDWGIPTSQAILNVRTAAPELLVFASGGLRNGVEIAKCLALGASLGGMASPYLKAAVAGVDVTIQTIQEIRREIQVCMFGCGAGDLTALRSGKLEARD